MEIEPLKREDLLEWRELALEEWKRATEALRICEDEKEKIELLHRFCKCKQTYEELIEMEQMYRG